MAKFDTDQPTWDGKSEHIDKAQKQFERDDVTDDDQKAIRNAGERIDNALSEGRLLIHAIDEARVVSDVLEGKYLTHTFADCVHAVKMDPNKDNLNQLIKAASDLQTHTIEVRQNEIDRRQRAEFASAMALSEIQAKLPQPILATDMDRGGCVLAVGTACILSGEGGMGKSSLTSSIALSFALAGVAAVQNSESLKPMRGGIFKGMGGKVLLVNYEDAPGLLSWLAEQLVEAWEERDRKNIRLSAKARKERSDQYTEALKNIKVQNLVGQAICDADGLTDGWTILWDVIAREEPQLVIVDPVLSAFVGDQNSPGDVRDFLNRLAAQTQFIGHEMGIMLVAHSNKESRKQVREAAQRLQAKGNMSYDPYHPGLVSGTTQWTDSVRGVMTMNWDPSNRTQRILRIPKANYGRDKIGMIIDPIQAQDGRFIGFDGNGEWAHDPETDKALRDSGEERDIDKYNVV